MSITQSHFGNTLSGQSITKYVMRNKNGMEVHCIDYGCRITNLFYPSTGEKTDIVLGFDNLEGYLKDGSYQGAIVGRYANRIENAEFTLNGLQYNLTKNDGNNFLHGDFSNSVFNAVIVGENNLAFTHASPNGADGFPGEMWVCVTYTLTDENELVMDFSALATEDTPINITNHSYFNLGGYGNDIHSHQMQIFSSSFLEANSSLCPSGKILPLAGTPMDFAQPKAIGVDIDADYYQLKIAGGYDHCYILDKKCDNSLLPAVYVVHPESGRKMSVYTTQPAIQFYSGNFLDGKTPGKGGSFFKKRGGFCLETQHYPSSPTQPEFPNTIVEEGKKYQQIALYKLGD